MSQCSVDAPSLAVIIPVYNGEAYLQDTLDSIYRQSLANFRLVVINDGSTDRTGDILAAQTDPRLEVITQPNVGIARTRQLSLTYVTEDLVALIDADDIAQPDRLERQYNFLLAHPDVVLVGSALELIDTHGRPLGVRRYPESDAQIRAMLPIENPIAQPSVMFRRQAALRAGGYAPNRNLSEDYDLWLRLARLGKLHNLPEPLTRYRLHPGQGKSTRTRKQLGETLLLRWKACSHYGYPRSVTYWVTLLAQATLWLLPGPLIYALFTLRLRLKAGLRTP
jgi:GT2 family glycosyltransferase